VALVELVPPGFGFTTLTATEFTPDPTGIVACSSLDETNVVANEEPDACSSAPFTKPVPITFSSPVVAPKLCVICALDIVGTGFHSVSLVEPERVGRATLTAVIVTGVGVGIVLGGV
jgi:hypothetical protein